MRDLAAEHAGIDADVGDGLGEGEGAAPGLAVFTRLRRGGEGHVAGDLLLGAALVDGREGEEAGQAGGGRAAIDPGQFKGGQREGEVLGAGDEAALFRLHEGGGDAGAVEGFEHLGLGGGPLVGVALAGGDQARDRSAGHAAGGLHEHLQVVAVGEAPKDLAHRVSRESEHGSGFGKGYCAHRIGPPAAGTLCLIGVTVACDLYHFGGACGELRGM